MWLFGVIVLGVIVVVGYWAIGRIQSRGHDRDIAVELPDDRFYGDGERPQHAA